MHKYYQFSSSEWELVETATVKSFETDKNKAGSLQKSQDSRTIK